MRLLTPSCTDQSRIDELRAVAAAIIHGMDASFGRRFRDQWPTRQSFSAAMQEWARDCERYGIAAINEAFAAIKTQRFEWPPSLPVFLGLLADNVPKPEHALHRALPRPKADPEAVAGHVAKMREALGR